MSDGLHRTGFDDLPMELVIPIVERVLAPPQQEWYDQTDRTDALKILRAISKTWKTIVESLPGLWAYLDTADSAQWNWRCVRLSEHRKLRVTVRSIYKASFSEVVLGTLYRWRELHWSSSNRFPSAILNYSPPHLETLFLVSSYTPHNYQPLFAKHSSKLTKLNVDMVWLQWPRFETLLKASPIASITIRSYQFIGRPHYITIIRQLSHVKDTLVDLTIDNIAGQPVLLSSEVVELPRLRSLSIIDSPVKISHSIVSSLELPQLEHIKLRYRHQPADARMPGINDVGPALEFLMKWPGPPLLTIQLEQDGEFINIRRNGPSAPAIELLIPLRDLVEPGGMPRIPPPLQGSAITFLWDGCWVKYFDGGLVPQTLRWASPFIRTIRGQAAFQEWSDASETWSFYEPICTMISSKPGLPQLEKIYLPDLDDLTGTKKRLREALENAGVAQHWKEVAV